MLLSRALLSSGVIIPLYLFPGSPPSCAPWAPLIDAIAQNPTVPFYAIVNPNSGPGTLPVDPSYQGCIAKIKAPNVNVIGYVATWFGDTTKTAGVIADVNTYASWGSSYIPDGIFFDQADSSNVALYTQYTTLARQKFKGGTGVTVLNPGTTPTPGFYNIADLVVTAENFFSEFSASQLVIGPTTPASKQGVILHDAPATPPTSLINTLIGTDHIGALYITDDVQANNGNPYDSLPSQFAAFVQAVKNAQ
ncbi:hypothetical protein QCA50_000172 [Cerrena zonata]|uniref:Spherulation-specific family 4 n=1 Tax=Cerrena zonata TaxID=2478898 RepID=A0AAW0GZJ5_9APHY